MLPLYEVGRARCSHLALQRADTPGLELVSCYRTAAKESLSVRSFLARVQGCPVMCHAIREAASQSACTEILHNSVEAAFLWPTRGIEL